MRLSSRIRKLQAVEVAEVSVRLAAAREALSSAEAKQAEYFGANAAAQPDWLKSTKKAEAVREDVAAWNLKEVRRAFDGAIAALEAWLADGTDAFFPTVAAWDEGEEDLTEGLAELVQVRQTLAAAFAAKLPELRSHVAFVPPVRMEVNRLIGAVQAVQRIEDVEIIPSVLSGRRTTSSQATGRIAERYKTSDDVARSLRMARPAELQREPEPEPKGILASFKKLFGR